MPLPVIEPPLFITLFLRRWNLRCGGEDSLLVWFKYHRWSWWQLLQFFKTFFVEMGQRHASRFDRRDALYLLQCTVIEAPSCFTRAFVTMQRKFRASLRPLTVFRDAQQSYISIPSVYFLCSYGTAWLVKSFSWNGFCKHFFANASSLLIVI